MLQLSGQVQDGAGYRLSVGTQPLVTPDELALSVGVAGPAGDEITASPGLHIDGATASADAVLTTERTAYHVEVDLVMIRPIAHARSQFLALCVVAVQTGPCSVPNAAGLRQGDDTMIRRSLIVVAVIAAVFLWRPSGPPRWRAPSSTRPARSSP